MASPNLLLTSFSTWKPEQRSNSSDDLLVDIFHRHPNHEHLSVLRQIPVDFTLAPQLVIQAIQSRPLDAVICCGMGEKRSHLCIEDQAVHDGRIRHTSVNVNWLVSGLPSSRVSHDAGRFVCNRLYFEVLDYLQWHKPRVPCIFIHVPVLTEQTRDAIATDFQVILSRMQRLVSYPTTLFEQLPIEQLPA